MNATALEISEEILFAFGVSSNGYPIFDIEFVIYCEYDLYVILVNSKLIP